MDPETIMNGISKEICASLEAMAKVKSSEEKLKYSEAIKNLCDSLGVFLNLAADLDPFDDEDDLVPF